MSDEGILLAARFARHLLSNAWAMAHGLAMLTLDGPIAPDEALIDTVVQPSR